MDEDVPVNMGEVAQAVLDALGGRSNVLTNAVCMTRLRVTLQDSQIVDYENLADIQGVLGTSLRGQNGLEVVFGPRVIDSIYHEFIKLTGISARPDDLFPMSHHNSGIHVQIRTNKNKESAGMGESDRGRPLIADHEMSVLENLFGGQEREDEFDELHEGPDAKEQLRLVVINGPNINMLGVPEKGIKADDFPALLELCKKVASDAGFVRCDCYQSNHEGDLVDIIQDAYCVCDGIVINPGAYGSSSALCDAIRTVDIPTVEVHLHKLARKDTVGRACLEMVSGEGIEGYRSAIRLLAAHLSV